MKRFWKVYMKCWDKNERKWRLGLYPIWKFIIMKIVLFFNENETENYSDFHYVSPKYVIYD